MPEATITTIFSNVEIIQNVNKEFYQDLENRMKRHSEISATIPVGDLFKKMGDYFKMYTTYCANHPLAVSTAVKLEETNPTFQNFLKVHFRSQNTQLSYAKCRFVTRTEQWRGSVCMTI